MAAETAKKYESLPMRDKIGMIAQTFGYTSGKEAHSVSFEQTQPDKPSVKAQLAAKPVPGDQPTQAR